MIMKKVLFSLLLILASTANANQDKLDWCFDRYKNVPQAYNEYVLELPRNTVVPEEAKALIERVSVVRVGDQIAVNITDHQIVRHLVQSCVKSKYA